MKRGTARNTNQRDPCSWASREMGSGSLSLWDGRHWLQITNCLCTWGKSTHLSCHRPPRSDINAWTWGPVVMGPPSWISQTRPSPFISASGHQGAGSVQLVAGGIGLAGTQGPVMSQSCKLWQGRGPSLLNACQCLTRSQLQGAFSVSTPHRYVQRTFTFD